MNEGDRPQSPQEDEVKSAQGDGNYIKFLGTAGARVVVAKQLRSSAGTFIQLNGTKILLDPGPGTLARMAGSKPPLDGSKLDAVILTHRHIDHSTDINVMIEAMSEGGFRKRGIVFAPQDCLEGDDPVILRYLRGFVERIEILKPHAEYSVGGVNFHTSGRHRHPVETYGVIFDLGDKKVSFLVDTQFFPDLLKWYKDSTLLIMNVVRLKPHESGEVMHLCLDDARTLISKIKPRLAVMTHLGMTMLRSKPWELAEQLSRELDASVIAATDGKTIEIA